MSDIGYETAVSMKHAVLAHLSALLPEVEGVGVGRVRDEWGFVVNLSSMPKASESMLPEIDGIPISYQVGVVTASSEK